MYTPRTTSYIDNAWPLLRDFGYGRDEIAQVVQECCYDDQLINERISDMAIEGASGNGWKKVGPGAKAAQNRANNNARNRKTAPKKVEENSRKQERPVSDQRSQRKVISDSRPANAPANRPRYNDPAKHQQPVSDNAQKTTENVEHEPITNDSTKQIATQDNSCSTKKGTTIQNGDNADTPPTKRAFTWASKLKSANPTYAPPPAVSEEPRGRAQELPDSGAIPPQQQSSGGKSDQQPAPAARDAYSWAARARGIKCPAEDSKTTSVKADENEVDAAAAAVNESPEVEGQEIVARSVDERASSGAADPSSHSLHSDADSRNVVQDDYQDKQSAPQEEASEAPRADPITAPPLQTGLADPQPQAQQPPHIPAQIPAAAPVLNQPLAGGNLPTAPPMVHSQQHQYQPPQQQQQPQQQPQQQQQQQYGTYTHHQPAQNLNQARAYEHYGQAPPPMPPYQFQQHPYPGAFRLPNYYDYDFGRARPAPAAGVTHHPTATTSYPEYYMGYPFRMTDEASAYGTDMRSYGSATQTRPDAAAVGTTGANYPYYYAYDHRRYEYFDNANQAAGAPSVNGREYRDYGRPMDNGNAYQPKAVPPAASYHQKPNPPAAAAGGYARPDPFRRDGYYGTPPVYMAAAAEQQQQQQQQQQAGVGPLDHLQNYPQYHQQQQQQLGGHPYNSATGGYFAHYAGGANERRSRY